MAGSCVCVSGGDCAQLARAKAGKKNPVPQISVFWCRLLLLITEGVRRWLPLLSLFPHCCKPFPLRLKWLAGNFMGWCPPPYIFIFFPFWETDFNRWVVQKQPKRKKTKQFSREIRQCMHTWEGVKLMPQAGPQHKDTLQQPKQQKQQVKTITKPSKPWGRRRTWFPELPDY